MGALCDGQDGQIKGQRRLPFRLHPLLRGSLRGAVRLELRELGPTQVLEERARDHRRQSFELVDLVECLVPGDRIRLRVDRAQELAPVQLEAHAALLFDGKIGSAPADELAVRPEVSSTIDFNWLRPV